MPKSLCRLVIYVLHAIVAFLSVTTMSFNAIRKNKILAKITGFTVTHCIQLTPKCTLLQTLKT